MKLILFEWKKFFKKKTTWAVVLLSVIAIASLYVSSYYKAEKVKKSNIASMKQAIEFQADDMKSANAGIQQAEATDASFQEKEIALSTKEMYEKEHEIENRWLRAYTEKDWQVLNHVERDFLQYMVKAGGEGHAFSYGSQDITWFTVKATLEELKLLEEHAIEPFVYLKQYTSTYPFLATIYEDYRGSDLKEWELVTERHATTGWSFIYQLIQQMAIPVLIVIGCFLFGNNFSAEIGKKKRGLLFYYTLPVSRLNVFVAKYVSGLVMTLLFVVCMLAVPLVVSLFVGDIGSLNYPVLMYDGSEPSTVDPAFSYLKPTEDTFHFIMLQEYLGRVLFVTVVATIMVYSFYYALSFLFKNPPLTVVMTAIVVLIGVKLPVRPYNPFSYFDMNKIINGEIATLTFNPAFHLQNGVLAISVLACMCIGFGYILFKRIKV